MNGIQPESNHDLAGGQKRRPHAAAGILFAMPVEADAFERMASDRVELLAGGLVFHEGRIAGRSVAWCTGGVGSVAAARAARLLLDGHRPRVLVSAGFAGGLAASLVRGAVVRPVSVASDDDRPVIPLANGDAVPVGAAGGLRLVTACRVLRTPAEKRALHESSGADLVDMETHAIASVAATAGVPCTAIRVISDDAHHELPREVAALAEPQSAMRRLGTALGAIGRRPRAALDLWRLYEHAVIDGRTLAAALAAFCESLPLDD